jgi:hypothetical protein
MMRKLVLLTVLGCLTIPALAAEPQFVESANQELLAPPPDKAQLVLLEPVNKIQGGLPVYIWSVKDDERTLLTVTTAQSKAQLLFEPGQHRLMATNMLSPIHFLDMNVEAGKRYYVLVRFVYGAGFELRPIRTTAVSNFNMAGADWKEWVAKTERFVETGPGAPVHLAKERPTKRINKLYAEALEYWNQRTDVEKTERMLTPEDAAPLW